MMRFAPGAYRYAAAGGVLAGLALFVTGWASIVFIGAAAATLWFFRDPERTPPPAGVVTPADGRVTVIRLEDGRVRLGIFMNITDVHVNRAPLAGGVESIERTPGAHRPAFSKDSDRNERVRIEFEDHTVILIAGWFARRVRTYVDTGDTVERGERIGHIAFGSRVDVCLPPTVGLDDLTIREGDSVTAGESVVALSPQS